MVTLPTLLSPKQKKVPRSQLSTVNTQHFKYLFNVMWISNANASTWNNSLSYDF